jgi:hypothetical protein
MDQRLIWLGAVITLENYDVEQVEERFETKVPAFFSENLKFPAEHSTRTQITCSDGRF